MKVLVILQGHYRTFDKTLQSWLTALEDCEYDFRFSTFDRIDHNTQCHWHDDLIESSRLTDDQIRKLKMYDPKVEIQTQKFYGDEINDIYCHRPLKTYYYRFNSIKNILETIPENKYDVIIISRFDILINTIKFRDLVINKNEIKLGGYPHHTFIHGLSCNDLICAFHPQKIAVFYNPPTDLFERKFNGGGEECWTDFCFKNFETVSLTWTNTTNFEICRA